MLIWRTENVFPAWELVKEFQTARFVNRQIDREGSGLVSMARPLSMDVRHHVLDLELGPAPGGRLRARWLGWRTPDLTLARIAVRLLPRHGLPRSVGTVWRFLERQRITFKETTAHTRKLGRPDTWRSGTTPAGRPVPSGPRRPVFADVTPASTQIARRSRQVLRAGHGPGPLPHGRGQTMTLVGAPRANGMTADGPERPHAQPDLPGLDRASSGDDTATAKSRRVQ